MSEQNKTVGENCPPKIVAPQTPPALVGAPTPAGTPASTEAPTPASMEAATPVGAPALVGTVAPSGTPNLMVPPAPLRKRPSIQADRKDIVFAFVFLLLGYVFMDWEVLFDHDVLLALFTALYVGTVLVYTRLKEITVRRESWFWMGILLLCGLSCALWPHTGYEGVFILFLLGAAVYWVLSLFGVQLGGKTDNWMPLDLCNGFFIVPFVNFSNLLMSFFQGGRLVKKGSAWVAVLLGILLCIPVLGIILPLLIRADVGFQNLIANFGDLFVNQRSLTEQLLLYSFPGILVAFYLFGLVSGSMHKRGTDVLHLPELKNMQKTMRFLPELSIYTVLIATCATYLLFICVQSTDLFSAFRGICPDGYDTYADYARQGFFELCQAATFNTMLLLLCNAFSRIPRKESAFLRLLNSMLSVLTLLLISTAFGKMALYVSVYGLTHNRVLTSWFMIFMALSYLLFLIIQRKDFSIVKAVAMLGAVMFTILCLCNLDGIIEYDQGNRQLGHEEILQVLYESRG